MTRRVDYRRALGRHEGLDEISWPRTIQTASAVEQLRTLTITHDLPVAHDTDFGPSRLAGRLCCEAVKHQ